MSQNNKYLLTNDKSTANIAIMQCLTCSSDFSESAAAMKRSSTMFLQAVVVLIGIGALAFLLGMPQLEGRNKNATQFEVYFKDPLLAYAYVASIPFFMALYQAFKALGYAGHNEVFSPAAVKAFRTIRYCATALIGFIIVGVLLTLLAESDDRPPIIMMGLLATFTSVVIATSAAMFERVLQSAVDIKSENDLTV
jgi:cytochrome bd-type quinol oxidase subunit 2